MARTSSAYRHWLLPVVWLVGAAQAKAAGKCEGQWHFELSRPDAAAEEWLPKGSFCRADRLPKALDAGLRYRPGGGVDVSGSPHQPADVLTAGGQCEFAFTGQASGLPEEIELRIEVPDGTKVVRGSAKCSHAEPRADGTRSGMSIALTVSGTHASAVPAAAAVGPDATIVAVLRACRARAADDLWNLMTPRFRAEVEQRATSLRQSLTPAELGKLYAYRGRSEGFTGAAYLRAVVQGRSSAENPCAGAARWKLGKIAEVDGGPLAVVHRPNGAFGLRLVQDGQAWRLDQITKTVAQPRK